MTAVELTPDNPDVYPELKNFFAAIPDEMADYEALDLGRLRKTGTVVYGSEHRPTIDDLGASQLGPIMGGLAGTYIEKSSERLQPLARERVRLLAAYLIGETTEHIAKQYRKNPKSVTVYRGQLYTAMRLHAPPLETAVKALADKIYDPWDAATQKKAAASTVALSAETQDESRNVIALTDEGRLVLDAITTKHRKVITWWDLARCGQTNPDDYIAHNKEEAVRGKEVCGPCPVRVECLFEALTNDLETRDIVLGGLSHKERNRYIKQLNAVAAKRTRSV